MSDKTPLEERYRVPGLRRGLLALEAFRADRASLSLSELGRAIGLSRSATYRLVYTLEEMGFVVRDPATKAYRLGARVLGLGYTWLASQELIEVARPQLEKLRDTTNCSAHLAIREGADIVYVARIPDAKSLTSHIRVGSRLPAYATSMGRVMLAELPADEIRALFPDETLHPVTAQTPADIPALLRQCAADRARGYVLSRGAYQPGVASVAAPVRDADGKVTAAINIATPEASPEAKDLATRIKDAVVETAEAISQWLGPKRPRPATRRAGSAAE